MPLKRISATAAIGAALIFQGCINSDGKTNPIDAFVGSSVSDAGRVGDTALQFSPSSYDFSTTQIGVGATKDITVTNTSRLKGSIAGITFSDSVFSAVSNSCGAEIAPSASCTITVRYLPTSAGSQAASMALQYRTSASSLVYQVAMGLAGIGTSALGFTGLSSIDQVTNVSMRLVWTHVAGAATYTVYEMVAGTPVFVANVTAPTSTYTVTGLAGGSTHTYRVRMTDAFGQTELNTVDLTATTSALTSTHGGWSDVRAWGAKTPAPQASDLSTQSASVTLAWNAVTPSAGVVASYNIYRSTTAGTENYSSPLATGINAATRSYTDSTAVGGTTYYYNIAPVVGGSVIIPSAAADREIKVIVPPDNMVLLHRWIGNLLMCTRMGRASDRNNNYRCAHTGPGGDGAFFDYGHNIFIDRYEQGCNYTYSSTSNKCGSADGCIGTLATPNGVVTGNLYDVYYSRLYGTCYINANGGTTWYAVTSANVNAGLRSVMGSAAPGLPPFVLIDQVRAQDVCEGQTLTGFSGTKRLFRRKELVVLAMWDPTWSDATIDTVKNGVNLNVTGHCNTNTGSGLTFENTSLPSLANRDTLPSCLNGDCAGTAAALRSVRTGSNATANCQSRFGAQDLAGNVLEWTSDQIYCNLGTCAGVAAASNTADTANGDFNGANFDGVQGPAFNGTAAFAAYLKVQFPIGIPIVGAYVGDVVVNMTAAELHSETWSMNNAGPTARGAMNGGHWSNGVTAGGLTTSFGGNPGSSAAYLGFRCAFEAD